MMNVGQLIEILLKVDPSRRVVISGYEGGVDDLDATLVSQVLVCLDVNLDGYYGPHEVVTPEELARPPDKPSRKSVSTKAEALFLKSSRDMFRTVRLWVDDERAAPAGWTRVTTPEEAIAIIKSHNVTELSLDHDLGLGEERTGYTVAVWLEEAVATRGFEAPEKITSHSANPVGRRRIEQAIANIERVKR